MKILILIIKSGKVNPFRKIYMAFQITKPTIGNANTAHFLPSFLPLHLTQKQEFLAHHYHYHC